MKKSVLKHKYFDFMAQEWQNWVEICKFMCLQLQKIGQPHLYMCGIFSKKLKFYNCFLSNGIFCLLEWTQLYFYLNEWQKQNCWYIFHYHLLNISWSYTHPIGVKYSILNQCFALVDTWSSEQAKPINERS